MSTLFDPAAFLDLPVDAPMEKRPPLPVGEYLATIMEVTAKPWQGKADPSKSGIKYDVKLTVEIPQDVQESLGLILPTLMMNDGIMLDLTAAGGLDTSPGKNRQLRNYRVALDMNKSGETFRASAMAGKMIRVRVTHEEYQGNIQERIAGVAGL